MKLYRFINKYFLITLTIFTVQPSFAQQNFIEDVIVTAEKRSESLQDISQSVSALTDSDLDTKNITSFVDLSGIVPGVTVAKNEGYKTVISIRGVGNETNQNAIAAPSVAFHMDGIFIASILHYLNSSFNIFYYLLVQLVYPFYVLIFGVVANFGRYKWKGRTY